MPTEEEAKEITKKIENICYLSQILLIIVGTHIPILAPHEGHGDFINRKGWTSYNVQIVADPDYIYVKIYGKFDVMLNAFYLIINNNIRDVNCKYPGASLDAYVFRNSGFFQYKNDLLPKVTKNINGTNINYLIVGYPAYHLLDWLLKGYTENLDPKQESFNAYLNSARIIIEQTVGKLKSRWRILKQFNEMDCKFIPRVVIVCCMPHNLIQMKKNPITGVIDEAEVNVHLEQPNIEDMTRILRPENNQEEAVRNAHRSITDLLPLRKHIIVNRK